MTASWASALAGIGATLIAALLAAAAGFRGFRADVKNLGKQLRKMQLAAVARDAREEERSKHQSSKGWTVAHVKEAIDEHVKGCRARSWEEDVSGVHDPQLPRRGQGGA
jgi:hypothetical protein